MAVLEAQEESHKTLKEFIASQTERQEEMLKKQVCNTIYVTVTFILLSHIDLSNYLTLIYIIMSH